MKQILLCCLLAGLASATEMEITLDVSETAVHPGADVTFVCRVANMDRDHMIWWFKAVVDSTGPSPYGMLAADDNGEWETNELMEQIAINAIFVSFYEDLERYSAEMSDVDGARLFMLNIKNVTDAETGYYGCLVGEVKSVYATRMFEVFEAPNVISFENVTSNITLTEGESLAMGCHVGHSVPSPIVTLSVGHVSGGFRDVTKQFERDIDINFNCKEAAGSDKTCPLNMDFSVSLSGDYKPSFMDNKKFLKCEASYPEYMNLPPVSTQLEVLYEYAPKFHCGPSIAVTDVATTAVLECQGFSNPAPINAYWEFTISGKQYQVPFNQTDGDFKAEYTIIDPGFAPVDDTKYKLTISNMNYRYFTNYKLKVVNSIGPNSTTIRLTEKETGGGGTDAATSWIASPLLLLSATLLSFIRW